MGLFDFVVDAGKKLLGQEAEQSPEQKSQAVSQAISELGLEVDNLNIAVEGQKAIVSGKVNDPEIREKVILAAGNIEGIGAVEETLEAPAAEAAVFYTVQSGDNLSAIAKSHYGDANKYPEIFEANKPMLGSPDEIYPGQVLRIPKAA